MEAQAVPREAATGSVGLLSPRVPRRATDARLVTLVREGNAAAFEAIYDRYHRPILSFCRHMLGDPEEAADAVQHTFLAAYDAIVSSDKTLLLRAWLFTIARNRCYSLLRDRREQPAGELAEPATEGLVAQVQRREDLRQLLGDMQRLPDDQRAALVLAELDTLNHQEIGTALGVPPTKVKALVFQARESLIASRTARDIDCTEIREQLSTLRGGALRRGHLRRHLRECQGCREFRGEIAQQRRSLAAILPVVPSLALKEAVLGGVSSSGASAGALAGGGVVASTVLKGMVLKALVALLVLIGIGGTIAAVRGSGGQHRTGVPQAQVVFASGSPGSGALAGASPASAVFPGTVTPFAHRSAPAQRSEHASGASFARRGRHRGIAGAHDARARTRTRQTSGAAVSAAAVSRPALPLQPAGGDSSPAPRDAAAGHHVKHPTSRATSGNGAPAGSHGHRGGNGHHYGWTLGNHGVGGGHGAAAPQPRPGAGYGHGQHGG